MGANATLGRLSTFAYSVDSFGMKPTFYTKDNGVLVYERVPVFRSGSFNDSMGYRSTYEDLHMKQMVTNYEHLRDNHIFDEVPVRDGHAGWLIHGLPGNGAVVGWHTNLAAEKLTAPHDGVEYTYLLADYEITDPVAREYVKNGTWRNRSAEIIPYVSNNEAEYWPVYGGFAFVDIPAVEGLKFSQTQAGGPPPKLFVFMNGKETVVGDTSAQNTPLITPAPQAFSVNGNTVTDPVAVQAHISGLEQFRRESLEANRVNFVNGLATTNRILATQVDSLAAFAKGLSPEQFTAWSATFEAAASQSVLGQHGNTVTNPNGTVGQVDAAADQISIWQDTVSYHKMAGTPKAQIEKSESYMKLVAAGKTPTL